MGGRQAKVTAENYKALKSLAMRTDINQKEKARLSGQIEQVSTATMSKILHSKDFEDYRQQTNDKLYAWREAEAEWKMMSMVERKKDE